MTAQINDIFRFRDCEYTIAGISEGELFDPAALDLKPVMASTACYRGFQAVYAILDGCLILADLHIQLVEETWKYGRKQGPTINNITPTGQRERFDFFNNHYEGINLPLKYSGGLLIVRDFIRELYVHMGFHPAWKYQRVIELSFRGGVLSNEFDRSEKMAEFRRMFANAGADQRPNQNPSTNEIREFVRRAFDRTYKLGG